MIRGVRTVFPEPASRYLGFRSYERTWTPRGVLFTLWREDRAVRVLITEAELEGEADLMGLLRERGEAAWKRALALEEKNARIRVIPRPDDGQEPSPL